jgi:hypothetical protein
MHSAVEGRAVADCSKAGMRDELESYLARLDVTAWLPRPGIRTYIFLTGLPTLLSRLMTSYLALYP